MKMNLNKRIATFLILGTVAVGSWSCKKMLDVPIENNLDYTNAYKNVSDADAAVLGLYGQFQGLQKLYIMQNELRADLLDITPRTSAELRDLSNHATAKNNSYIDPRPYYQLIVNCNDVLKNFDKMNAERRMSVDDYNKHYSDIGALRTWIYLQLGIQYGSVPYITEALETVDELNGLANYPRISFDTLLDRMIAFTESLPYKEVYAYPTGTPIVATIDGSSTAKLFISKLFLLGDLHLWKGNYLKASEYYAKCMNAENGNTNDNFRFNFYKVSNTNDNTGYTRIGVIHNRYQDESTLVNSVDDGWRGIFGLPNTTNPWNSEWFWALPYNPSFKPINPMIDLVSPTKSYQIRPSQAAKDNWNSQTQFSGIPNDARARLSFSNGLGGEMITKFTDNGGKWGIYRAALLHLRFAEAANRDGQTKLGWAFLNIGLTNTYYVGAYTAGVIAPINEAEQNTMITPYATNSPYYFDARKTADISGTWYRNSGVRGRAGVVATDVALQNDMIGLEGELIDEAALELAFEGNRWPDLVRIARRQNNPAFLADRVYQKLLKSGNPNASTIRAKLMNPANWYLPFEWK